MFKDSIWYPKDKTRSALLTIIIGMVAVHESSVFGLLHQETLVLGWLPAQLFYDVLYNVVGVGVIYAVYRSVRVPDGASAAASDRDASADLHPITEGSD